jgi:hypothetical protein
MEGRMKNKQRKQLRAELSAEISRLQQQNQELQQCLIAVAGNPVDLVASLMGGIKALVVPDLPPSAAPPDLFGGAEKEINFGHVPDPAWDVPQILPSEFVEMDERERLEGGGGG